MFRNNSFVYKIFLVSWSSKIRFNFCDLTNICGSIDSSPLVSFVSVTDCFLILSILETKKAEALSVSVTKNENVEKR